MASRNVDLLIRARDNASRAFDSVAAALKDLGGVQAAVSSKSEQMNAALKGNRSEAKAVASTFAGDLAKSAKQAETALGRVEKTVSASSAQFEKQKADLGENREAYRALGKQAAAAAEAIRRAEEKVGPPTEEQAARLVAARKAYRELNREIARGAPRLAKQEEQLAQNAEELSRVKSAAAAAQVALRQVQTANDRAQQVLAEQATTRNANASARSGLQLLSERENQIRSLAQAEKELADREEHRRRLARVSEASQKRLAAAFRDTGHSSRQAGPAIRVLLREISRVGPEADQGARALNRMAGRVTDGRTAFRAFYGDSRRALSLMQRIRGEVLSLTASFVGFYGVFNTGRGISDAFQAREAARSRLGAAFNQDQGAVDAEFARLVQEADRLGISFDLLSENFSKFLISGQQAGLEAAELRTIFRQVSEAGRVLKLSNDQIAGTFNALIQIAGKGTLQMEELRQQLGDRLPGAVGLVAQSLGYGTDELAAFYKAVENGQIGAREALLGLGQGLEETYGGQLPDVLENITTKFGAFQNLLFQRQLTAADSGFIAGLESALDALNAWLDSPEGIQFFEQLGSAFGSLFEILPAVLDNFDTLQTLGKAFVAIKMGQVVGGLAGAFGGLGQVTFKNRRVQVALNHAVAAYSPATLAAMRSSTALGTVLRGLRGATASLAVGFRALWVAVGGPIGAIVSAIAGVATLFGIKWVTSVDTLNSALRDHKDIMAEVGVAHSEAAGDVEKFKKELEELSSLQIEDNLRKLRDELDELRGTDSLGGRRGANARFNRVLLSEIGGLGSDAPAREAAVAWERVALAYTNGASSAAEVKAALVALRSALGDTSDEVVELLAAEERHLDKLIETETAIARNEKVLAARNGTAKDAAALMDELAGETEELADKTATAADKTASFEESLRELAKQVPSLNREIKRFDAIAKIEESFQNALRDARALPDEIMRIAAAQKALQTKEFALGEITTSGQYEARYTAGRGTPQGAQMAELVASAVREGVRLGISPEALLTAISYETAGTFDPWKAGPTTQWGQHRGLIQWGEPQRQRYGVTAETSISDQMRAVGDYLIDAGVQAGDGLLQVYAAINGGHASKVNVSDAANGGAPGTVLEKVSNQMGGHKNRARGLLSAYGGEARSSEDAARDAERRAEAQEKYRRDQEASLENARFEASIENERLIDRETAKALREAEMAAQEVGLELTQEERDAIRETVRLRYASQQAEEDRNAQLERAQALEERVTLLAERRRFLIEQQTRLEGNGDLVGAARVADELEGVEDALDQAIEKALAFWRALGGPEAEAAILALQTTQHEVRAVSSTAVTTGKQINDLFADRLTSAVDSFNQMVADGVPVAQAAAAAFRKAAAEILLDLAKMILRQTIFNALSGGVAGGMGGLGGLIAGGINALVRHNGGLANANSGISARKVNPAVFANAVRYHSGGIAGFAPDEFGAILKKNEEVLTEQDPRHRFNLGAASEPNERRVKVVNAVDGSDAMEQALSSSRGESVFVNWIRSNRDAVNAALEV